MAKTLGIIGGMGPLATAHLFQKIIACTRADRDQEHIRIFIDNNTGVPDRTAALLAGGEDPRPQLIDSARKLEAMGADFLIMPCNTAHAYYGDIVDAVGIPFLSMIDETARFIRAQFPETTRVGLLSTAGTCETGVYDRVLEQYGLEVRKPSEGHQKAVTAVIYGIKQGLLDMDLKDFFRAVAQLRADGPDVFVLGCTELSVAYDVRRFEGGPFIDPVHVIATAAIRYAGKAVREACLR
jgi:aspartate racemase